MLCAVRPFSGSPFPRPLVFIELVTGFVVWSAFAFVELGCFVRPVRAFVLSELPLLVTRSSQKKKKILVTAPSVACRMCLTMRLHPCFGAKPLVRPMPRVACLRMAHPHAQRLPLPWCMRLRSSWTLARWPWVSVFRVRMPPSQSSTSPCSSAMLHAPLPTACCMPCACTRRSRWRCHRASG